MYFIKIVLALIVLSQIANAAPTPGGEHEADEAKRMMLRRHLMNRLDALISQLKHESKVRSQESARRNPIDSDDYANELTDNDGLGLNLFLLSDSESNQMLNNNNNNEIDQHSNSKRSQHSGSPYLSYFASEDSADRLVKGKRVNRNMFSSGLQGVWGIPGRR